MSNLGEATAGELGYTFGPRRADRGGTCKDLRAAVSRAVKGLSLQKKSWKGRIWCPEKLHPKSA